MEYIDLGNQPLDLNLTFTCGQAFRWTKDKRGLWRGVVGAKLLELAVSDQKLYWRTYPSDDETLVRDYLRLGDDVLHVYESLGASDEHLKQLITRLWGLRLVRQNPSEALISFVCSAANSIPRISASIAELCSRHGDLVCEHDNLCYYAFPKTAAIAEADELSLRTSGSLAFRGKNIKSVANQLLDRGEGWLTSLAGMSLVDAKTALTEIKGVGEKIADCVCLFSLDKDDAVPVDTHVRQIANRLFMPDLPAKSVTGAVYHRVEDAFRERYGKYAGWAQQFLFYEDLLRDSMSETG